MHLLDTSTFLWRPRFSTFWHASLLIFSQWTGTATFKNLGSQFYKKKSAGIIVEHDFISPFSIFSISSPHPPKEKIKTVARWTKHLSHKIQEKNVSFPSILPNKKQELPSKDPRFSRFGVTDPISLGMPTQVGGSTVFCWEFLVTLKKSCGSEYQRELLRNIYMF